MGSVNFEGMSSKIRGRCGFSRSGAVRSAPEGAPTEADSWSACPDLRKAIPRFIEMIPLQGVGHNKSRIVAALQLRDRRLCI